MSLLGVMSFVASCVCPAHVFMVSRSLRHWPWLDDSFFLSTDDCRTGVGGYFNRQYFHTPCPTPILCQFGHNINILELLTIMVTLILLSELLCPSVSFCSVIMRTACLQSILHVLAFLGCIFVYGKSGFSPLLMTLTSLPGMFLEWTTPMLITSVVGIYLQFITHAADMPIKHVLCSPHLFQFEIDC